MIPKKKNSHLSKEIAQAGICTPEDAARLSRREFIKTGVSFVSYLSLAHLWTDARALAQSFSVQRNLVWVSMTGGWDILEVTDPKPSSTSGIDMSYSWEEAHSLAGADSNVKIGRFLPNLATHGEDVLVVRGIAMGTTSHNAGRVYMDTGVLANSGNVNAASIPAIVASESNATIPIIQLDGGMEPLTDRGLLNPVSVVRAENLDLYRSLYPETDNEKTLRLKMLDYIRDSANDKASKVQSNDRLTSITDAEAKIRTQINADVGSKLVVTSEDTARYTNGAPQGLNTRLASAFALAGKLITNNLVHCINLGVNGFDTHANQEAQLRPRLTSFDWIISKFIEQLKEANKLDSTLIVLYSDFGRTPKINASNGRDHWPVGGCIMIGGGIKGGRVVGGTDDDLLAQSIDSSTGAIDSNGIQLNPTHIGGSVLELTLGSGYLQYREYLSSIPALTQTKT